MNHLQMRWQRCSRVVWSSCRVVACLLLFVPLANAQRVSEKEPRRPTLKASADTNDWMEYHSHAMRLIVTRPQLAAEALYWAERLEPTRAEAMYARWAALWMTQPQLLKDYFSGTERVLNSAPVRRLDSLNYTARLRNPMVNQAVRRLVLQSMYNHAMGENNWEWNRDPEMLAWLDYTMGKYEQSATRLSAIIEKNPQKHYALRYDRALALYAMGRLDSGATEMTRLVEEMHRRDQKELTYFYNSKAMFEYGAGIMYAESRQLEPARQAFMRALTEDLAFYPAHRGLGAVSLALGDTATAINEYQQALELNPADLVTRYYYALVLMNARQRDTAIEHLKFVVDAEPHFAAPYYYLGRILDLEGRHGEALTYYTEFLPRAQRSAEQGAVIVRKRVAELSAAGVSPAPLKVAGQ